MTSHANTTPIPPGIEVPGEVRTRLGTLRFFDGFPDDATTRTLFDNLDFQRAVQAYLLGLAPVAVAAMRRALVQWGPANSTLVMWEDLVHPRFIGLVYNTSTSYNYAWLDLHDGPVVVEVPPKVYGAAIDSWCRWVIDVGITGPDQGQGGRFLFVPPGYDGEAPDGDFVVRSRTYGVWVGWRGFRDERGDPQPAVEMIKNRTRIYPIAQADDPSPTRFVNVSPEPMCAVAPADHRFWELLDEVVQSEPPESADPLTLGMFASVGIRQDRPFDPDERMRAILAEAAMVGDATARALTYRFRQQGAYFYPGSAWRSGFLGGYSCTEDGVLLLDSAAQLYFVYGSTSPAWDQKMVGTGSQYANVFVDATGAPFDGGRTYRLHVPPNVPVNNFWSILVYDTQTRSMLQTDQQWPSVTSQDADVTTNEDGSVDVCFGPEPPAEGHSWVQTLPGKGWFAMFRLYGPLEPWFDKTWRLPDIEPVG
ncbi:DUF1254 domain-containing protein [Rhodococcus aetherivorans]|uniref:DUF1254 domain-containing protein n=1 Tax=Rhodococcus aetherivorans TaxID=191292 RepID=A0AA46P6V0_9NOCA|nr:DUF1254 domain-containing protein [Rhodococcus aetherivorans]KDE13214.1 signal peptide protein [Rhodococcus aetherivorans]NCL75460.1 hypothetical protein [Rhodococcus sp. YH1]UGQ43681.1 DUF1254 domain-containing protein [Rhodococcus aetherivorans]UYF91765.1 DUF1254 domain-containing protein [Rhodococcus aetherivorans]